MDRDAANILERAQELLRTGVSGGIKVRRSGRVEQPIRVLGPDGGLYSWFVPVTVGNVLAGFFEIQTDMTLKRFSSFQRREDSLEGCPPAEAWIDVETIARKARGLVPVGEIVQEPFLTFDGAPSRIAWRVELQAPDGAVRTVYVAGDVVWESERP